MNEVSPLQKNWTQVRRKKILARADDRRQGEQLIDIDDVSRMLLVSKNTLYDWCATGKIPYVKLGGKFLRFYSSEIAQWIEAKKVVVKK
jgi:excisionase family DNA binding protein